MKPRLRTLTTKLLALSIVPLLAFGIAVLIITTVVIYAALRDEVKDSLHILAHTTEKILALEYPGEYRVEGNILFKGDFEFGQNYDVLDDMKELSGADITLFLGDARYLTTILTSEHSRAIGTIAAPDVTEHVLDEGLEYFSERVLINGEEYFGYYIPTYDASNQVIGMIFAGKPRMDVIQSIGRILLLVCLLAVGILILTATASHLYSRKILTALRQTEGFLGEIAVGNLTAQADPNLLARQDEIGEMGRFSVMLQESITDLVGKDPLTGLHNRRSCNVLLDNLTDHCRRSGGTFSIVMADIDHFKRVNDTYGHQAGDEVLKMVSQYFSAHMGPLGHVFRWGGEEFLLVYDYIDRTETRKHLERLKRDITCGSVTWDNVPLSVTMTYGIAEFAEAAYPEELISLADHNLYYGKNNGRNRIVSSDDIT